MYLRVVHISIKQRTVCFCNCHLNKLWLAEVAHVTWPYLTRWLCFATKVYLYVFLYWLYSSSWRPLRYIYTKNCTVCVSTCWENLLQFVECIYGLIFSKFFSMNVLLPYTLVTPRNILKGIQLLIEKLLVNFMICHLDTTTAVPILKKKTLRSVCCMRNNSEYDIVNTDIWRLL